MLAQAIAPAAAQPARPTDPEPVAPEAVEQVEARSAASFPAPAAMAPMQSPPSVAQGSGDVCSAICDRVASCQIATKDACMPVCAPQLPALTPEQRAQMIPVIQEMGCEDLARFGAKGGAPSAGAAEAMELASDVADGDGQDS